MMYEGIYLGGSDRLYDGGRYDMGEDMMERR